MQIQPKKTNAIFIARCLVGLMKIIPKISTRTVTFCDAHTDEFEITATRARDFGEGRWVSSVVNVR